MVKHRGRITQLRYSKELRHAAVGSVHLGTRFTDIYCDVLKSTVINDTRKNCDDSNVVGRVRAQAYHVTFAYEFNPYRLFFKTMANVSRVYLKLR